jgi:hypothetical protein
MRHYQILEVLEKVELEFSKTPECGLCILVLGVMDNSFASSELNGIYGDVKLAITKWPKYSGDMTFPIELDKTSKHKEKPEFCFDRVVTSRHHEKPPYYDEYIALRGELLRFLIMHFNIKAAVANQANIAAKKQADANIECNVKTDK